MSTAQNLTEPPCLSRTERREIELEEDAQTLAACDALADANFQMLDAMETEDDARRN